MRSKAPKLPKAPKLLIRTIPLLAILLMAGAFTAPATGSDCDCQDLDNSGAGIIGDGGECYFPAYDWCWDNFGIGTFQILEESCLEQLWENCEVEFGRCSVWVCSENPNHPGCYSWECEWTDL